MDHQISVVDHDGRWLVDVGFGQFALAPLSIDYTGPQWVEGTSYLVDPEPHHDAGELSTEFRVSTGVGAERSGCYIFCTTELPRQAFQDRCRSLQTSAESSFVHKRMCSMHTRAGRLTLSGNQLLLNGSRVAWVPEEEYGECLKERFGIVLPDPHWIVPLQQALNGLS
jgi:N-hydroxyarylamine O-acetyltransferase